MELEEVAKKLDQLSERLRLYLTEDRDGPTMGLLLSGVRSSLESIGHHLRDGETKLDNAMATISEMKALLGENTANIRALRNRFYCLAGESEFKKELSDIQYKNNTDKKC